MSERSPRQVYLLSPRHLSPETIAVTFAKTSRSPLSFREIASELSDEKSAEFHERWVVGYGHASVAEHAVLHLAFENVSRLAIECIESNRLASYTEKSTRYQQWEPDGFHVPVEVIGTPLERLYRQTCRRLFDVYRASLDRVRRVVQTRFPRQEDESEARWEARIRSRYVDVCRYLLPAASLANVGMTVNARALEHALRKMLAHPLAEVREIGVEARTAARVEVPTLLKYAEPTPYLTEAPSGMAQHAAALPAEPGEDWLSLLAWDAEGEVRVLAAALYERAVCPWEVALAQVRSFDGAGRRELAARLLGGLDRFDVAPRALEHTGYTFEVVLDQGAYFELKRHRLMTQTPQRLTASLGYAVPRLIAEAGFEGEYRAAMGAATEAYERLAGWNPDVAAYVVPNGFNRRVLVGLNLREAFHFCELRSAANAHFAIRRVALRMAERLREVHPLLCGFMRLPEGAAWQAVEAENFVTAS
jgi:thymidylate synthase ThyX